MLLLVNNMNHKFIHNWLVCIFLFASLSFILLFISQELIFQQKLGKEKIHLDKWNYVKTFSNEMNMLDGRKNHPLSNLTNFIQMRIARLQNPDDCSKAR